MTDEKPGSQEFKVVDKRRFTNEGETKSSSPDDDRVRVAPTAHDQTVQDRAAHAQTGGGGHEPMRGASERGSSARDQQPEHHHASGVDFPSFVVSLATQALVMLGEIPNPETQSAVENLEAAKQTIDILALLEEKTKGNLSGEEQRLIAEVLTSLRLTFVKKIESRK
ncbi:MAG: DUF1844 domain-containing protein [Bdellovibrionota bacterium]